MKNRENSQKISHYKQQASKALRLSTAEIAGMWATRSLIGAAVVAPFFGVIRGFSEKYLPRIASYSRIVMQQDHAFVEAVTGKEIRQVISQNPSSYQRVMRDFTERGETYIYQHTNKTPWIIAGGLAVTIGAVLTASSVARYRKEQAHVEEIYAQKLKDSGGETIVPAVPSKDEMLALRSWRDQIKSQQRRGDVAEGVSAAMTAASVVGGAPVVM